jgi:hypothetical protein
MLNIKNGQVQRIIFTLVLIVFFFLKLEDCQLPYYWDELGVYSQASLYMYDHTPSLLPGDIPEVLSRGHPLLFMFVYACFFKLFGTSVLAVHIFTCLISILFLVVSYRIAERFFSPDVALLSSVLLIVQPLFFAQSVFVLPEIMLGVFSLLSIYFYLDKKIWTSSIFAALALLTKETAIVLPLVIMVMQGIRYYKKEINGKKLFSELLIVFLPYYIFGLFIIVQRIQNGWFFYPYHTGFISFSPGSIYWRMIGYLNFIFIRQGRITWLILIIITIPYVIFRNKINIKELVVKTWKAFSAETFVMITFLVYVLGILSYSALNYPLQRYILLIYPVFAILIVLIVFYLVRKKIIFAYGIVLLFAFVNIFFLKSSRKMVENDMAYKDLLKIQIEISRYFDKEDLITKTIAADFPVTPTFFDPRLGYVSHTGFHITGVSSELDPAVDFYVYTNPGNLEEKKVLENNLQLVKEFHRAGAEGYIYKVIK